MKIRVKGLRYVKASELRTDGNWKLHPATQRFGLTASLAEIGFCDPIIARETEQGLFIIDGHMRAEQCGDQVVPVVVLDVDEREAAKLKVALDGLGLLSEADRDQLDGLLGQIESETAAFRSTLQNVADRIRSLLSDEELLGGDAHELSDSEAKALGIDKQVEKAKGDAVIKKMAALAEDTYDIVCIVCKRRSQLREVADRLGIELDSRDESSRIGVLRGIRAERFLEAWDGRKT